MPQFDLTNASLSASGLTKIKDAEKFIPFVYDDGYPIISVTGVDYEDNDSKPPSASTNYISEFYGRVPYEPGFHTKIRGTLTIGYGTTFDGKPLKDNLYHQVYTDGIDIGGTTYTFPAEFTEAHATNSTGGFFKDSGGTQQTGKAIRIKYTGDDSSDSNMVFSESLAEDLLQDKLAASVAKVKSVFSGHEDSFPYDTTLAQQHFDMMVSLCFHQGTDSFEYSYFVSLYKDVDGTSVSAIADLTAYNDAAYAIMWLASVGYDGTYYWVQPQIDRRNNDIDELVGTDASRTFPTGLNPLNDPDWYQGVEISTDYFSDIKNTDFGLDGSLGAFNSSKRTIVSEETLDAITPSVDFHTGPLSALKQVDTGIDFADIYTGNRSIYDSEPGSSTFYQNDPLYQKYYSKFWQPNEKFYHGNQVSASPRSATKHGAVFATNPDGQTPAFILGLNEDGSGTSKVYMRSTLGQSSISNNVDSGIWDIADGKSLGTIDYGQWNHFAITRSGNVFRTFKNGTKVSQWTSNKALTRNTRDGTLKFSIGRSQGADYFYGYIDDFRITKGSALYTEDFTAPSSTLSTTSTTGLYNGDHYVESVYSAINKVSEQLGTEYRINTDATLDAGLKEVLFQGHGSDEPPAIIVRDTSGEDPAIVGLIPESITSTFDAEDYVSGVELLTQAEGSSQSADHAEAFDENTPYRDLYGAPLERVQFIGENDIPNVQRQSRAQAYLNELKKIKKTLSLSLEQYEIQGDFNIGDMIYVYDPEIKFEDTEAKRIEDGRSSLHEVAYRGQIINPEKIRITGITWPVKDGYGVYLRKVRTTAPYRVEYIDLTDYVSWESGNTQLDIGDLDKRLGEDLRFSSAVTGITTGNRQYAPLRPKHPDTGVEGDLKLTSATLQDAQGRDNAIIFVEWEEPTYDNGTPIQNGLQYQIQWKPTNSSGEYQSSFVNWNTDNNFTIEGLQLATNYTVRVSPILTNANTSDTPATGTITTAIDTAAPSKPGPANTVAAGALRVQIIHNLGRAEDDDGNPIASIVDYTLQRDTHHLNVYASTTSGFSLSTQNDKEQYLVGELLVGASSIRNQIPVIGEVQVANGDTHYWRFTAVDNAGNESDPSDEQSANGNLVATANISDAAITTAKIQNLAVTDAKIDTLTAGKITAGTIAGQEIIVGTNTSDSAIIKSSNYFPGSAGWKIDADGTAEFESGNFRGDITGASGTFSGDLSAAGGTFSGDLSGAGGTFSGDLSAAGGDFSGDISGASGTFTGDLSGSNISGGTIDIGGSDSTSFHVDTDGNMWLGAGSIGSAPFQVSNAGAITATSGEIGGWEISSNYLRAENGSGQYITLYDNGTISGNYTAGSSGWAIDADGDAEFNSITIRLPSRSTTPTGGGNDVISLGNSFIYNNTTTGLNLISSTNYVSIQDQLAINASGSSSNPSLYLEQAYNPSGGTDAGFYVENDFLGSKSSLYLTNGLNNILHTESNDSYLHIDASNISVYGGVGSNGEVLGKTANGLEWVTAGGTHPDSDHTSFLTQSTADSRYVNETDHSHSGFLTSIPSEYLTESEGDARYVNESDHSHSGFVTSALTDISFAGTATGPSISFSTSGTFFGLFSGLSRSGNTFTWSATTSSTNTFSLGNFNAYNVNPRSNNSYSLGTAGQRWTSLWLTSGQVTSSDERFKTDIADIDYGLDFINTLSPKKYKLGTETVYVCGESGDSSSDPNALCNYCETEGEGTCIRTEQTVPLDPSNEYYFGFVAQDVNEQIALDDYRLVNHDSTIDRYFMDYDQLIGPLVKAVQELSTQISDLTARIEALEG